MRWMFTSRLSGNLHDRSGRGCLVQLFNPLNEPQCDYVVIANRCGAPLKRVDDQQRALSKERRVFV